MAFRWTAAQHRAAAVRIRAEAEVMARSHENMARIKDHIAGDSIADLSRAPSIIPQEQEHQDGPE